MNFIIMLKGKFLKGIRRKKEDRKIPSQNNSHHKVILNRIISPNFLLPKSSSKYLGPKPESSSKYLGPKIPQSRSQSNVQKSSPNALNL